jgi:ABC-2 type transport system ATP-binding protein
MALLAGTLQPQQGRIRIDGAPLARLRATDPTRIGLAPQDTAFYPSLTVMQNLACFVAAARVAPAQRAARVAACLALAQLERYAATRAERLSGGLKRRLNLAIALLPQPQLLLLDEPTVGVDPQTRAFVLEAIRGLAAAGAAVLFASHYMAEIEAIADRVVILDHGRVLRDAALAALLAEGPTILTLAADGLAAAPLHDLLARFGAPEHDGALWRLRLDPLHAPSHTPAAVLAALAAAGARVTSAEFGRDRLEHLFMALTGRPLRD